TATLPTGVTVDIIVPAVPVVVSVVGASAIVTAGFRKDAALTVSGTAEPSSTVELWDGAVSLGTVTTNAQGQWSLSISGLTEASHGFKARATDLAGNIGSISAATTVIVDLTAPNTPIFSGPGLSKSASPTIIGSAESLATVTVTIAGSDYLATADNSGNWSLNLVTAGVALAEGSNGLVLKSTDRAGNSSSTTTGTVVVDTIAPDIIFDAVTGDDRISKVELAGTITLTGTNELGATVSIAIGTSGATPTVTGTSWTYTLTSAEISAIAAAPTTTIVATATDTAGNSTSKTRVVSTSNVVAAAKPVLLSADDTGLPDNVTSKQIVRIDVGGLANVAVGNLLRLVDGSGATLAEFTMDSATVAAGTKQFTLGSLANPIDEGTYSIFAVTVDTSINDKATSSGSLALTIDKRVPGAPSTPNLLAAHDKGASNTDNITNKNSSLSFEIRLPDQVPFAAKGDTLRLYRDLTNNGATTDDTVVASQVLSTLTNPQTLTLASTALADGTYYYYSRLFVASTNSLGTASNRVEVVIDTTAANKSGAPVLFAADDSGVSNSDNITFVSLPELSVSLTGTGAVAGDRVDILSGGTVLGGVELTSNDITANSVNIQLDQALVEGANTLLARLTDRAGNPVNSSTLAITLDTIQPAAGTIGLDTASDSGASNSDKLTNTTTPTFSGTAEAGAPVDLFDTGSNTVIGAAVVADSNGKWTITVSPALAQGVYSVVARVTDPAGNAAADSATIKLEVDTTAPVAPAVDLRAADDTGVSDSDNITKSTVLTLSGSTDPFAVVELFDGSTSLVTISADSNGAWSFTAGKTTPLTDGTYAFSATSTDAAGNVSVAGTVLSVIVDTAAPVTPTGVTLADDTGSSNSDKITSDKTITVAGTAEANARVVLVDAQKRSVSTTANGSGAFSLTTADLADGAQALVLTVTDVAGNTNAGTTINLTVDTTSTAPVLSSTSANLVNGVFSVTVTFPEDVTGFDSTDI
ncbi:MAG: Ig-like domain-containing protein, partial [Planctomycetota bacterium]